MVIQSLQLVLNILMDKTSWMRIEKEKRKKIKEKRSFIILVLFILFCHVTEHELYSDLGTVSNLTLYILYSFNI